MHVCVCDCECGGGGEGGVGYCVGGRAVTWT